MKAKRILKTSFIFLMATFGAAAGSFAGTAMGKNMDLESTALAMQEEVIHCKSQEERSFTNCIFNLDRTSL